MVCSRFIMLMQLRQIVDKIVYPLGVEKFPDNLGWLCIVDCSEVLLHRGVVVAFLVQMIAILSEDDVLLDFVDSLLLREIDGKNVEIPFIQDLKLLL